MNRWIILIVAALYVIGQDSSAQEKKSWTDSMKLKGDVRYRYEFIDDASKSDTRTRERVRARIGAFADVNETVKSGIQLCSGEDDPVSSNQTVGDSFSSKGINLDLAYIDWMLAEELKLKTGKMEKPFLTVADLVWDGDLNPEGVALVYATGGDVKFLANAGHFWIDENSSSDSDDRKLYTGQIAMQTKVGDMQFLVGLGGYIYDNMKDYSPLVDESKGFGNSLNTVTDADGVKTSTYKYDYTEMEAFFEVKSKLGAMPAKLFGQFVQNSDADDNDTGFLAGFKVGDAKNPGTFAVGYDYRSLEKDAVVGALTDSDSFGGGSNGEGHKLSGSYAIAKNWALGATYFLNSKDPDNKDTDYNRLQIDLACKF